MPDDLKLVHRSRTAPEAQWGPDQYSVTCEGLTIGGISKESMAGNAERWWWEITTREAHQRPAAEIKGAAGTLDDAMGAFRRAWDAMSARRSQAGSE